MEERPRGGVSKVGVTWGLSWVEWVRWSEGVKWGELASIPDANKIIQNLRLRVSGRTTLLWARLAFDAPHIPC